MNERIQKFAEEAAWKTRMTHNNAYWRMQEELAEDITWREKFAELIVRECADVALQEEHDPSDCILGHFGLKR